MNGVGHGGKQLTSWCVLCVHPVISYSISCPCFSLAFVATDEFDPGLDQTFGN